MIYGSVSGTFTIFEVSLKFYKQDPEGRSLISASISESDFLPATDLRRRNPEKLLIIGFDTEYQSIKSTAGVDNELLSYQYCCSVITIDSRTPLCTWSGIVLPDTDKNESRLSIREFVEIAISDGLAQTPGLKIPRHVYLVAHFTRADVPGFIDFKEDSVSRGRLNLQNLRNTFVNVSKNVDIRLRCRNADVECIDIQLQIRDTIHLAPAGAKSLKDLGEILNFEKIQLAATERESLEIKKNMRSLLRSDWELFRKYAIRDAEVCTRYSAEMIYQNYDQTGSFKLPLTLTSIGVDLLQTHWKKSGIDPLLIAGKEAVKERVFKKRLGYYQKVLRTIYLQNLHWHIDFVTECYHGGRNEQFWFGPGESGLWFDYDLQSAYPSAMSLIGIPNWGSLRTIKSLEDLLSLKPVDLAYANVNFEFPSSVRYPCLPVRTDSGIIFPRKGNCSTHISEILLAVSLGARLEFIEGRFIESKRHPRGNRVFNSFLEHCVEERNKHPKKTVMNLFWKEVANSTYGKVSQGLRPRRIYNLKDDDMETLEESKITNPFFASFITAFCRGTLSEIMNNLSTETTVFSVTTDGFLTNATEHQIIEATKGTLSRYYISARRRLSQSEKIYEVKHVIRQPIGWRTRGQATLVPGAESDYPNSTLDDRVVLAKGGIKLPEKLDKTEENLKIVDMFIKREPNHLVPMVLGLGIKDMYLGGKDFIDKSVTKRLSMEFDWKRKPLASREEIVTTSDGEKFKHLCFSTEPWDTPDQFFTIRELWGEYRKSYFPCIKTEADYEAFSAFVLNKLSLGGISQKYLRKKDGDLERLKRDLITAWRFKKCGTHHLNHHCLGKAGTAADYKLRAHEFADLLNDVIGIPCKKSDVDNGVKQKTFTPNQVPSTTRTQEKLQLVKELLFPLLEIDQFLGSTADWNIRTVPFEMPS